MKCLTALPNHHRSVKYQQGKESSESSEENQLKARVLVEPYLLTFKIVWKKGHFTSNFHSYISCMKTVSKSLVLKKRLIELDWSRKFLSIFHKPKNKKDGKNKILVFEQGMYIANTKAGYKKWLWRWWTTVC